MQKSQGCLVNSGFDNERCSHFEINLSSFKLSFCIPVAFKLCLSSNVNPFLLRCSYNKYGIWHGFEIQNELWSKSLY